MSQLLIPIPSRIEDGECSKPREPKPKSKYGGILEKLDKIMPKSECPKRNKEYRNLQSRVSHVLNLEVEDNQTLKSLQHVIQLDMSDSYVSFGAQKNSGSLATAKTNALVLSEENRKKLGKISLIK